MAILQKWRGEKAQQFSFVLTADDGGLLGGEGRRKGGRGKGVDRGSHFFSLLFISLMFLFLFPLLSPFLPLLGRRFGYCRRFVNSSISSSRYPAAICIISFLPCMNLFTQILDTLMDFNVNGKEKIQVFFFQI